MTMPHADTKRRPVPASFRGRGAFPGVRIVGISGNGSMTYFLLFAFAFVTEIAKASA